MGYLREFLKLFQIIFHIKRMVFKALFTKDRDARNFLTNIYLHFLNYGSQIPITEISAHDITDSFKISATRLDDTYKSYMERLTLLTDRELLSLLRFLKQQRPKKIFEFGIGRGGSLLHFIDNTTPEVEIVSFDLSLDALPPFIRAKIASEDRVTTIVGDSNNFDLSAHFETCDLIFIDGGHEYQEVKIDTSNAFKMLKSGGVIIWDDYNPFYSGVFKVVNNVQKLGLKPKCIKGTSLAFLEYDPAMRSVKFEQL